MSSAETTFMPAAVIARIAAMKATAALTMTGIAKPDPDSDGGILFDPTASNGIWVAIPAGMMSGATPLQNGASGPVTLVLKPPAAPEAAAFAQLLQAFIEMTALAKAVARQGHAGAEVMMIETESGTGDSPCTDKCDRDYPNSWWERWCCKLYCP